MPTRVEMGKKSKKSAGRARTGPGTPAVAPAAAASAVVTPPAATSAATGMSGAGFETNVGVGIVVAGGGGGSSGKKPKCVRCLSTLKDLAKAHGCSGCSQLFCWRCERKTFWECPNGKHCVDPQRRCRECVGGKGMAELAESFAADKSILKEFGANFRCGGAMAKLTKVVPVDESRIENLTTTLVQATCEAGLEECTDVDILSENMQACFFQEEGYCRWNGDVIVRGKALSWDCPVECSACAFDTDTSRPSRFRTCFTCRLHLCNACNDDAKGRIVTGSADNAMSPEQLRTKFHRMICRCKECTRDICVDCCLESTLGDGEFDIRPDGLWALCPPCAEEKYWSTKPCTNPSCPNEVGVPTKRCGGCHLDRYCSVECQAAVYPSHIARCLKIQAKRAAAGKEVNISAAVLAAASEKATD